MNFKLLLLSCILLFLGSCSKKPKEINFYYWKAKISIGDVEKDYFQQLHSRKLYIRFFDVDVDGTKAIPKAKIEPFDSKILNAEYIPVVFITNRTFTNASAAEIDSLPQRIYRLIGEIMKVNKIASYDEIQIDCDWTTSTREAYFSFLKKLKILSKRNQSCTVRLHQIKYKKQTGIPPVDKVYFMCYATENPSDKNTSNSILDLDVLKDYLQNVNDYPLPFDIDLPIFGWGIVTNHLGKIKLINDVTVDELDTANFEATQNENVYRIKNDCFFHNMYLNKDFTLRIERISPQLLEDTKLYLRKHIKKDYAVIYYHLDSCFLKQFKIETLKWKKYY